MNERRIKEGFSFNSRKIRRRERLRVVLQKSIPTILGRVSKHLVPLIIFLNYGIKPKDFRHLGARVDFVAFKGLPKGEPEEIIFIKVESGSTTKLNSKERRAKELVEAGKAK